MIPILLILIAIVCYFLGSLNGALILSKYIFHKDIRKVGSGNAGFTNVVRNFGAKWGVAVVGIDVLKSIIGILFGGLLMSIPGNGYTYIGRLFAGFCLILGLMYPSQYQYRGGKGVVCFISTMWLTDWRIGMVISVVFIAMLVFTQYMSLASLTISVVGIFATWIFIPKEQLKGLCGVVVLIMMILIVWRHRGNIIRLIEHQEPKLKWGKRPEKKMKDEPF